jgi:hypothetical protein
MDKKVSFIGNMEWMTSLSGVVSDGVNRETCDL